MHPCFFDLSNICLNADRLKVTGCIIPLLLLKLANLFSNLHLKFLVMQSERRSLLKKLTASFVGLIGLGLTSKANTNSKEEKQVFNVVNDQEIPLFSQATKFGGMVFIAGQGAHVEPFEIKAHTEIVLKGLEKQLVEAGSSMEKVLKVTVYLNDINDYDGMNEVYRGRFGKNPPVRSTIAVAKGGVPGKSFVEMDCSAIANT
jgi:2-iminobutanoate/2-iminopropanoate deaminase